MEDAEEYNKYDEMELFIDFLRKIKLVEASIDKDDKPWLRNDGVGKVVRG